MPRFKQDSNSASFISELAEGLAKLGHDIIVLTPYDPLFQNYKRPYKVITYKYIWPAFLHKSGYSRVLKGDKKMKPEMYLLSTLMSISALLHLIKIVRQDKIDIISSHWVVPNGFIAYLASKVTGVPYTVTIPGSDVFLAGKSTFFRLATGLASRGANWVISDSQHYLEQLGRLNISPKNTSVVRYGVDTKSLKPTPKDMKLLKELTISQNDNVVLALGRFVEKKGFVYLIEAMPKVIRKIKNTKLILVGDGELRSAFEKKIRKLKLIDKVIFTGAVPYTDRARYYNLADVFVMPSVKDSKGNIDASPVAMMDAMVCGIPVVATKYSGSPDLVINGQTGWMVKENSSGEIAEAIVKLLGIRDKTHLKRTTRNVAVNNFSLEKTGEHYSQIFKSIGL